MRPGKPWYGDGLSSLPEGVHPEEKRRSYTLICAVLRGWGYLDPGMEDPPMTEVEQLWKEAADDAALDGEEGVTPRPDEVLKRTWEIFLERFARRGGS